MPAAFPRFASLDADHFRTARLSQRLAAICAQLEASKELAESQCLSAIVLMTTIIYLLARTVDSLWIAPFILPIVAIGAASLQHAVVLYGHYVRAESLPAVCEGIGRLRHAIGEAPDLCFERMVRAGLLPRHSDRLIDDAFYGDYRGRRFSLAMVDLWRGAEAASLGRNGGDAFRGVIAAIRWPERPASLPADDLSQLVDGCRRVVLAWFEGHLLVAIPCWLSPFSLGGLFARPEQLAVELQRAAAAIQIPHRLIDFMLSEGQEA